MFDKEAQTSTSLTDGVLAVLLVEVKQLYDTLDVSERLNFFKERDAPVDEAKLIEKLALIEALFVGASSEGEKNAAAAARTRIQQRLKSIEEADPPREYRFSLADLWSRRLLLALLRRYGFSPYRYTGQRHTTLMVKVSKRFVDEILWPEFEQLDSTLRLYLNEVTERVISQALHQDSSEAKEVPQLGTHTEK